MDILLVATELAPYVAETAAADMVASLAKSLRVLGHDVTVALPRYPAFEEAGLLAARRLTPLRLDSGTEVVVLDAQLPSGVELTLFDAPRLFDRPGVYGENGEPYPDNARRFGFFSEAAAALVRSRAEQGRTFDIVHLHDYAAGLTAVKLAAHTGPAVPTVLTVHDGKLVGTFGTSEREALGIPTEYDNPQAFRLGSKLCALKGAVVTADRIVATSPTYARHLESPEHYGALSRAFREAATPVGIVGGVDYSVYNPATDPALQARFDAEDLSNKGRNKASILKELDLELEISRPLFVSRAVPGGETSLRTLAGAMRLLMKNPIQLVVFTDDENAEALRKAAAPWEDSVSVVQSSSAGLIRRALGAADFYIGLERSNPSGAALLQAQRYAAVPVALAVDAAIDVVVDCDAELETGTGFLFDSVTQRALAGAVARAVSAYASPAFGKLVRRVVRQDLGWDRPARRYVQVYRQALAAHA